MLDSERNAYLEAMQITPWLPRTQLPFAPQMDPCLLESAITSEPTHTIILSPEPQTETIALTSNISPQEKDTPQPTIQETPSVPNTTESTPHFSLQLMQAGKCLLLVELTAARPLQMNDPSYQLLRNILKACQLPDSPHWLGDVIHWPLFKNSTIVQGRQQAQEFLQSFINTHQQQHPECNFLWLIGSSSIRFTTGIMEPKYNQHLSLPELGSVLFVPNLETLVETPQYKAELWHSLQKLIPLWS